jgi:hypothetical protein
MSAVANQRHPFIREREQVDRDRSGEQVDPCILRGRFLGIGRSALKVDLVDRHHGFEHIAGRVGKHDGEFGGVGARGIGAGDERNDRGGVQELLKSGCHGMLGQGGFSDL